MYKDIVGYIDAYKAVKLFYKAYLSDNSFARIIFLHGAGEYSEKYTRFFEWLAARNIDVFAIDMRGHGRSSGAVCHVDDFNEYALDLEIFAKFIDKAWSHKKTFIVSHSLGGLVSIFYTMNFFYKFDGVIACSPCLKLKLKIEPIKAWLANVFYKVLKDKTFSSHVRPRLATHDKATIEKFVNDPLIHHLVTASFYVQLTWAMRYVKLHPERMKSPLLILQAGDDKICDAKAAEHFFEKAGSHDKNFKLYRGFFHELLNETDREMVFFDIYDWIKARG